MNDLTPPNPHGSEISATDEPDITALRIVAGFGLGLTALVVLAIAGGTLSLTPDGVIMNVNPTQ